MQRHSSRLRNGILVLKEPASTIFIFMIELCALTNARTSNCQQSYHTSKKKCYLCHCTGGAFSLSTTDIHFTVIFSGHKKKYQSGILEATAVPSWKRNRPDISLCSPGHFRHRVHNDLTSFLHNAGDYSPPPRSILPRNCYDKNTPAVSAGYRPLISIIPRREHTIIHNTHSSPFNGQCQGAHSGFHSIQGIVMDAIFTVHAVNSYQVVQLSQACLVRFPSTRDLPAKDHIQGRQFVTQRMHKKEHPHNYDDGEKIIFSRDTTITHCLTFDTCSGDRNSRPPCRRKPHGAPPVSTMSYASLSSPIVDVNACTHQFGKQS